MASGHRGVIGALNLDEGTDGKETQDLLNLLCPTAIFVLTGFCKAQQALQGLNYFLLF